MIQISTPTAALHFSYAVHACSGSEADASPGFQIHLIVHRQPCPAERMPMVLIVEFDYMRLAPDAIPPAISLVVEGLHLEMPLGQIELRLVPKNDASDPASPGSDGCEASSDEAGQTWGFKQAA